MCTMSLGMIECPSLACRQKLGGQVVQALGVSSVGELAGFTAEDLITRFGATTGAFLAALPLAQDEAPVRDRGPQKSIMAERSFPPLESVAAIETALHPLAASLLQRLAQVATHASGPPPLPPIIGAGTSRNRPQASCCFSLTLPFGILGRGWPL